MDPLAQECWLDAEWLKQPKRYPGMGDPEVESFRLRVVHRESKGNYQVADPKKRYFGAYQFHIKTSNLAARKMNRMDLVNIPANKWAPEDQDGAFYVIFDQGKGKGHWPFLRKKSKAKKKNR